MKKVSIIVPVYNASEYIEKCIDSLINQTLDNVEIIVVDDGSTDDSYKKLKKYGSKIKLIKQENSGVATTRNNALKLATGDYIAFVDSDDYIDCNMFKDMYNKAIECDFDVVECDFKYVDDTHEYDGVQDLNTDITSKKEIKQYFIDMYPVIWNKLYKKEILKDIKFKDGVWAEDVEFLYRVLPRINTLGKINKKYYYYYQRQASESRLFDKRIYNYIDNFNGLITYYKKNNIYKEYKKELEYCYVRYLYATFIKRALGFDKIEFKKARDEAILNVKKHFPKYRRNSYFYKSFKGIYLVLFNKLTANLLKLMSR